MRTAGALLLCLAGAHAGSLDGLLSQAMQKFQPMTLDYSPEYADERPQAAKLAVKEFPAGIIVHNEMNDPVIEPKPVQKQMNVRAGFVPNLGEGRAVVFRKFRKEGPQWSGEARMPNARVLEPLMPMMNALDAIMDDLFSDSPFMRASSPLVGVFGGEAKGFPMLRNAALMQRQPQQSALFKSQAPAAPTKIQLPDGRVVPLPAVVTEALAEGRTVDIEVRDTPQKEPSAEEKERAAAIKANRAAHQWQESGESAAAARAVHAAEQALAAKRAGEEAEQKREAGAAVASGKLLCAAGAFLIFLSTLSLCCCCVRPRVDDDDDEPVTVDVVDTSTPLLVEYTVETVEPAPAKPLAPLPRDEPAKL